MGRRSSLISRFVCQRDTIITSEPVTNNVQKQCRTTMDGTRIVLLVSVMIASDVRAWKHFHLGRERGGNVKAPETTHRLPPDQWFTQKLDHFNPTDERVWQQVSFARRFRFRFRFRFRPFQHLHAFFYRSVITPTTRSTKMEGPCF